MRLLLGAAACLTVCACALETEKIATVAYDGSRIKAHVHFLADDALKGRKTASAEYRIAANYVASQFAEAGLEPVGDDGGYFQEVPFRPYLSRREESKLTLTFSGAEFALELDGYYVYPTAAAERAVFGGDLVFAGYGIDLPSRGLRSYGEIDVENKMVVLVRNLPDRLSTAEKSYYRAAGRYRLANERGAAGIVWLSLRKKREDKPPPTKSAASRKATTQSTPATKPRPAPSLRWTAPDGSQVDPYPNLNGVIEIQAMPLKALFEEAGISFDQLQQQVAGSEPIEPAALNGSISISQSSTLLDIVYSPNVVAMLPGSDPALKDEYVVITGHLDHLGVNRNGQVMPGALDNAAVVSIIIEIAQSFKNMGLRPRRSILFVATTGEELSLQGSSYFVHYPVVDRRRIVANINIDMPVLLYDFAEVFAYGAEYSSLGKTFRGAAAKAGVGVATQDPMPELNAFMRSDHYPFVKKGIPAIFPIVGLLAVDQNTVDAEAVLSTFFEETYHRPADNLTLGISYDAAAKFARVVGNALADTADGPRPVWEDDNFYRKTFVGDGS